MATLRDVARAAGVSPATASRALSSPHTVSVEKRQQVLQAAELLGYQPNRSAQALATGRSGHLGLVLPDLANPFFASIAKGVQARAREMGMAVLVADSEESGRLEQDIVDDLQGSVDGVILCSPRMSEQAIAARADQGPLVLVNRKLDGIPSVSFDAASGIRQALAHLRALGHRTVAYVGGPATSWSEGERRRALDAVADVTVVDIGNHRPVYAGGFAATDLALETGATAVLCYNDLVALGVMNRLRARGLSVPDEVSVVGFDDIPAATFITPMLTTVAIPLTRAGREAVDLLASLHDPDAPPAEPTQLAVELMVRDSTAPRLAAD